MNYTFSTDDENEALKIMHAGALLSAMSEIYNMARNQIKYGEIEGDRTALEAIRNTAFEAMGRME